MDSIESDPHSVWDNRWFEACMFATIFLHNNGKLNPAVLASHELASRFVCCWLSQSVAWAAGIPHPHGQSIEPACHSLSFLMVLYIYFFIFLLQYKRYSFNLCTNCPPGSFRFGPSLPCHLPVWPSSWWKSTFSVIIRRPTATQRTQRAFWSISRNTASPKLA